MGNVDEFKPIRLPHWENGPIRVGDPLTSSSQPGVAMKATAAGKILGYALESADKEGRVLVFVQPGYYAAPEVAGLRAQVQALQQENAQLREQFQQVLRQVQVIQAKLETTRWKESQPGEKEIRVQARAVGH